MKSFFLIAWLVALAAAVLAVDPPKPVPPVAPGKDTTVIAGPLDAAGLLDYEAALNAKLKGKSTAETNALVALVRAIGPKPEGSELHADFYKQLGIAAPPADGAYLLRYHDFFGDEIRGEDSQAFFDRESELRSRPWTVKEEPKFAEWIAANEKPLAVIAEAVKRPDYFYPMICRDRKGARGNLIGCLLSFVQKFREFASVLGLRATLHLGEKQFDAAWQDVMTMHRLARHVGKGACLIELLVGIAIDAIAQGTALRWLEHAKPTAKTALACRDELAKLPPMPLLAEKVDLMERYLMLDCGQFVRRDGFAFLNGLLDRAVPDLPKEVAEAALRQLDWDRALKVGNKWYDRLVAEMKKPARADRMKGLEVFNAEWKKAKENADFAGIARDAGNADTRAAASDRFGDLLAALLLPAATKVGYARDRNETQSRTESLAFTLAAHFADHKKYPAKLADLVPKYAAAIPDDVFSGKALVYRTTEKGYELYSVGLNEKDDDGHLLSDAPPGDDLGHRMPAEKKEWPPAPGGGAWPFPPGGGAKK